MTGDERKKQRVVIAGGGTAGWMTAALLARTLGRVLDITLIESDQIGTIGVGEATIPPLLTYNQLAEIDEATFMSKVQATFKLGIEFVNWRDVDHRYIHSFGITGKDHWTAGFQHFWLKGLAEGHARDYGDYCLELRAAEENRFAHLPKLGLNYAYHVDATLYAAFLRQRAEADGVRRVEGKIDHVTTHPQSGDIESVTLADESVHAGDLFIDCTGFRGLLIDQALHVGFEDWSHWLLCDSALAVQTESTEAPIPYTRSTAHGAGWQWRIPLQHRVGNGLVFSSRYMSVDEARETLLANLDGPTITEPFSLRFRTGTRHQHWHKNCVAIGLSAAFVEPLESTAIHLIQRSITRLCRMFPLDGVRQSDVDEFNAQTRFELENIRDFIILHYKVTNRRDTRFWRYCQDMEVPEDLAHRIRLFRETGQVFRKQDELFAENSWIQVMLGQGLMPEGYHPIVDAMQGQELQAFLDHVADNVDRTMRGLPVHADYIRQYCPASPPKDKAMAKPVAGHA
ncbi:tryptophan halogenase family protein [Yunchengibacter salinarum]|uniref:tryptophan halogenase family protein n=1 Tax=Yunchengibacter salinarum TaxID=3133399 RepID=UPI0035B65663